MNENIAGQDNFSLPHDVVLLPSQGKFYKNKKKSVKVGFLTASDENLLANVGKITGEQLLSQLIRNKLYEPELNPNDLLEGDIEAILLFLRNTSFGPEYNFSLTDPETGQPFKTSVVLDELNFIKSKIEPSSDGTFETKLPKTGSVIKLKPLTYGEKTEIEKMVDSYPQGMVAPKVTWRLMKQIIEVNGDQSKEVISKFIESMPIMDSKYITNFLSENEPRIDLMREITAPSGKKVNARVSFGAEFFRPFF